MVSCEDKEVEEVSVGGEGFEVMVSAVEVKDVFE